MANRIDFAALMEQARETDDYWIEKAKLDFTEEVVEHMEKRGMNRVELARRLGRSPAYVTKLLRGNNNFTLQTMVQLSQSFGCQFRIHLHSKDTHCQWLEVFEQKKPAAPFKSGAEMIAFKQSYRPRKDLALSGPLSRRAG
jgi:antitoxin component HigA of HigAB toxin-antitoxin module